MDPENGARSPVFEHKVFMGLLLVVSLAFFWVLSPYFSAVFWGAALAILSIPLHRRLLPALNGNASMAALLTLLAVLVVVILPLAFVAASLVRQSAGIYQSVQSGEFDIGSYFQQTLEILPDWMFRILQRLDLVDLEAIRQKLSAGVAQTSRLVAGQALTVGQLTLDITVKFFIALYLSFFLLRDGARLGRLIRDAIPLNAVHKRNLITKFVTVIRATIKGNVLVALAQGALGGLAFWFLDIRGALLWAALMAFLSLIPAVGAGLVWLPVALYFLATGSLLEGAGLIAYGVLVIGLVDNVLRPILVGKDTKMPDYVVLISTLGGLAIFGLNGFVIGPMIAAMFIAVWDIFAKERAGTPDPDPSAIGDRAGNVSGR